MQTRSRRLARRSLLPSFALALAPALLGAQEAVADSALRSAGLAGSVAVALNGSLSRYDEFSGSSTTAYGLGAGVAPFFTDHLQLGVSTSYFRTRTTGYDVYHNSGAVLAGNYAFGGGARWRGYAGGYAGGNNISGAGGRSVAGVQVGALYFLDPAVAVQAEYSYGRALDDNGPAFGRASVGLQPFLFGRAGSAAPAPAGLGVADVDFGAYAFGRDHGTRGARASFAPYLTRWLQVGGRGQVDRAAYSNITPDGAGTNSLTAWSGTGFARAYLPLGARVQPFAGASIERSTTAANGYRVGQSYWGPALGLRYFLNARVALDGALERRIYGRYTGSGAAQGALESFSPPNQSVFAVGLATRFGRAR